jgi:hypothetical protein
MLLLLNILMTSLQNTLLRIITECLAASVAVNLLLINLTSTRVSVQKPQPKSAKSLIVRVQEKLPMQPVKESKRIPMLLHLAEECLGTRNLLPKLLHPLEKNQARFLSGSYRVCNLDKLWVLYLVQEVVVALAILILVRMPV